MKQALLIVPVILAISAYGRQINHPGTGTYPGLHQNTAIYAAHSLEADARKVAEEHKTSANVTRICDTCIPPVCLLLVLWLALTLPGYEEGKSS